jgi:hypothetical protein
MSNAMIQTPSQIIALQEHGIEVGKLDQRGWHGALKHIIGFEWNQTTRMEGVMEE